jgi:hypothetical protein
MNHDANKDDVCSICAGTGKAFGKACVCRIEAVDGLAVVAHDLGEIPPALGIAAQADDAPAFKEAVDAMNAAAPVPAVAQEDERQAGRDLNNTPCPKCGRRTGVHTQEDWEECFGVKTPPDEEEEGEQRTKPVATVIKKGADRQWMSENLGSLPDGMYSLYLAAPSSTEASAQAAAAASSESVDTPELRRLLYALSCTTGAENKEIERRVIAHIKSLIAARVAGAQTAPTDLSKQLRSIAKGVSSGDYVQVRPQMINAAAQEIERYYCGMLAWKGTAEAKDRKFANAQAAPDAVRESATDKAIQRACRELPDGYDVIIELEHNAGSVVWIDEHNERHVIDGEGHISDDINEAVNRALEHAAPTSTPADDSQPAVGAAGQEGEA